MSSPVLVAGASGFVGHRLCRALVEAGHDVRAMTRHPDSYDGAGEAVRADVADADTLGPALGGCTAAYYLVHSLDSKDFERLDAEAARAFGRAAAEAGVEQIIYLGGLGSDDDDLSTHLRSRRQVEGLLGEAGVPVTVLRAGILVGSGGISWEITRQLVDHLPAMVAPRWVSTRTQPIAVDDVVRYLIGVLGRSDALGQVFEVGGPEVLKYADMIRRVARIKGRHLLLVPVPLLTPGLSARWLGLVTDVDRQAGRSLIDSMSNEVVVHDDRIRRLVPFEPMGYDDMVTRALGERETAPMTGPGDRTGDRPGDRPGGRPMGPRIASWAEWLRSEVAARTPMPITHVVPVDYAEPPQVVLRRKRVVAVTSVLGAATLGVSLSTGPGSRRFYVLTLAAASVWTVGGLTSGPLHLGWIEGHDRHLRRPWVVPVVTGVGAFGFFYGCALVARRIPVLDLAITRVLAYAEQGSLPLVLLTTYANGLGEEIFFRGALYAVLPDHLAVPVSAGVYTVATATTRNPALVLAAALMGGLFGLQRRASGGLQAPLLTHLTWQTLMVRYLPPLFRHAQQGV